MVMALVAWDSEAAFAAGSWTCEITCNDPDYTFSELCVEESCEAYEEVECEFDGSSTPIIQWCENNCSLEFTCCDPTFCEPPDSTGTGPTGPDAWCQAYPEMFTSYMQTCEQQF